MIDAFLNFIYPPLCQICRGQRASSAEGYVCSECWAGVRFITPPFCQRCGLPYEGAISTDEFQCENCRDLNFTFSSARSAVHANGLMLDVIHRYKYKSALWFEPFLAGLLVRQAAPVLQGEKWDAIVPVPLHRAKEREREFNQAARLARHLSAATGLPVRHGLVRRVKPTNTQTRLTRPQRAANVAGAFAFAAPARLAGENIVLLDDVLTTGATTDACARALREGGAGRIGVWTLARGA
ncbi:MAG TPA: ComF family protein [Verrucomicrobiae bacterium]|jgi:ComF family protein|nr:ComF family protein [Verrucomicrobiae bacterium]